MTDLYLDAPPPGDQRIRQIHVWIATYANGSEGIISADLPMPVGLGTRHMPLMNSKRDVAENLQPLARRAQRAAMHQADRIVSIRLVTFAAVDEIER